jgi:hypothetical protein
MHHQAFKIESKAYCEGTISVGSDLVTLAYASNFFVISPKTMIVVHEMSPRKSMAEVFM